MKGPRCLLQQERARCAAWSIPLRPVPQRPPSRIRRLRSAFAPSCLLQAEPFKRRDLGFWIGSGEHRVPRDERIGAGLPYSRNRVARYAAVDLEKRTASRFGEKSARPRDLVDRSRDELLSAKPGIDRHHQQQIEIGRNLAN